jgi:hypothetical protein
VQYLSMSKNWVPPPPCRSCTPRCICMLLQRSGSRALVTFAEASTSLVRTIAAEQAACSPHGLPSGCKARTLPACHAEGEAASGAGRGRVCDILSGVGKKIGGRLWNERGFGGACEKGTIELSIKPETRIQERSQTSRISDVTAGERCRGRRQGMQTRRRLTTCERHNGRYRQIHPLGYHHDEMMSVCALQWDMRALRTSGIRQPQHRRVRDDPLRQLRHT